MWSRIAGVSKELRELEPPDRAAIKKLVEKTLDRKKTFGLSPIWWIFLPMYILIDTLWDPALLPTPLQTRPWRSLIKGAIWFSGMLAASLLWYYSARRRYRNFVRAMIRARGVPLCMVCGYNLTANTSGVCPECGASLEHSERVADEVYRRHGRGDDAQDRA